MSALRKAGVWLGLIEDDEEDLYDEPDPDADDRGRPRGRSDRDLGHHDHLAEQDEDDQPLVLRRGGGPVEEPVVPRSRGERSHPDGAARSLRGDSTVSYLTRDPQQTGTRGRAQARREPGGRDAATRDNLALAPQVEPDAAAEPERRYQITTLHPTTYREARTIGEHFREGTPVIMNLTEMDEADARRLVDFGAGLAFGLHGTMERVTNRVFLLSPADVQVTPEDKARIAGGGYLRQR